MTRHTLLLAAILCASVSSVNAQDLTLPVGTWTGTVRRIDAGNRNRNPAPASLVVAKVKDPHVRWRGGSGEMLTVTLRLQNQSYEVGTVEFTESRLALSFTHPERGEPMICALLRQKDGSYEGDCTGAMSRRVMLTPPAPAPEK